ncbi:MAG: metallophosphoesterase [Methanoregulaceae archaeon]|jgi:DNA repair exonuclease SbcCD nuclease subunit
MKIVHIADTHLGLTAFNRLDPETGMNLREKLIYNNFLSTIDHIILKHPDALVHSGDLFDQIKPKTKAYTTVLEALDRLHEADIPFVVIAGNHSMTKTRYTTSPFQVLTYHPANLYAAYSFQYEKVELGDTIFHLIPNMLHPQDYRTAYDQIELSSNHHNVLVTHGLASVIKDKRLATVAEHELDNTILSPKFDYIALGHYHRQSQITDNAWYSGSIEYLTYGEINDKKGGLVIDLNSHKVQHISFPSTPMIDIGSIDCGDSNTDNITLNIVQRIEKHQTPALAMVQVTLENVSREHGKGPDIRTLAKVRERLLDLKFRIKSEKGEHPVPIQQDIRAINYLQEFGIFVKKQQLSLKKREFVERSGLDILKTVMEQHKEAVDDH